MNLSASKAKRENKHCFMIHCCMFSDDCWPESEWKRSVCGPSSWDAREKSEKTEKTEINAGNNIISTNTTNGSRHSNNLRRPLRSLLLLLRLSSHPLKNLSTMRLQRYREAQT
jgi:hypothetical protein